MDKFTTPGGAYFYRAKYSKINTTSVGMLIDEPVLSKGKQYIELVNSSAFHELYDVYVVLTVVAIAD